MVKDTDVVYIALLKTTSLCTFVVNKTHRSTRQYFYIFFYRLPAVKSNTMFGKMILMALDKYSLEMEKNWFTSVLAWRNEQQQ